MDLSFALGGEIDFGDLPAQQRAELKAQWASPEFQESNLRESRAALRLYDNPPALGTLGNMPFIVVSATENQPNGWADLQNQLAALSTHAVHRFAQGTAHASLAFNPQHSQYTIQAVQDLLKLVQ